MNKFVWGLEIILIIFSVLLLFSNVLTGISFTAPFSAWSFGYYLAVMLPFLCIAELFLISFYSTKHEKDVSEITFATPISYQKLILIRSACILLITLFLYLTVILLAVIFYFYLFGFVELGELGFPILLLVLPSICFCLGSGWFWVKLHPMSIYGVMILILLLSFLPMPGTVGFSLFYYFIETPLQIDMLDPSFQLTTKLCISRVTYTLIGLCLYYGCLKKKKVRAKRR